jgi:predicted nucleic acid-binding protein
MIAWLRGEQGADVVDHILLDPSHRCLAHSINLCEVYYDAYRHGGELTAHSALQDLERAGIVAREDMSPAIWQSAGALKAVRRRISLADCLAVTLALFAGGTFLTSDHHEFDAFATEEHYQIAFIR